MLHPQSSPSHLLALLSSQLLKPQLWRHPHSFLARIFVVAYSLVFLFPFSYLQSIPHTQPECVHFSVQNPPIHTEWKPETLRSSAYILPHLSLTSSLTALTPFHSPPSSRFCQRARHKHRRHIPALGPCLAFPSARNALPPDICTAPSLTSFKVFA